MAGQRHPDEAAVEAAQRYAAFCVSPSDRWDHRAKVRHACAWVLLPLSVILGAEAVLLHRAGVPTLAMIPLGVLAVASLAYGIFWLELLRECRRLLALPAAD